jgi:hypothetical protein
MWRRVDNVLTDVSEESIASIFKVEKRKKIGEQGTLKMKVINTISTRRHITEDCLRHSHRRENLKSYMF